MWSIVILWACAPTSSVNVPPPPGPWMAEGVPWEGLGQGVALADVNGDGFSDIVGGTPWASQGAGGLWLFQGTTAGPATTPDWIWRSSDPQAYAGSVVARVGDLNSDGFDDIATTAPEYTGRRLSEGAVFVFMGGPAGLGTTWSWSFTTGVNAGGISDVAGCDVDSDGFDDLIVGSRMMKTVWLFRGSPTGPRSRPDWSYTATQSYIGTRVACGDVDGDGFADLASAGESVVHGLGVLLFPGSAAGLPSSPARVWSYADVEDTYIAMALGGDLNGDGFGDMVLGARLDRPGSARRDPQGADGRVDVYFGTPGGPGRRPDVTLRAGAGLPRFGTSVAHAGDVNGDGFGDLVVGAPNHRRGEFAEGAAYLYLGSPLGPVTVPAAMIASGHRLGRLGMAVTGGGDADGDGFADVIAAAPGLEGDPGRLWMYRGRPAFSVAAATNGTAQPWMLTASQALPGSEVRFFLAPAAPAGAPGGPCRGALCLDLRAPDEVGVARADAAGSAVVVVPSPQWPPGTRLAVQAVYNGKGSAVSEVAELTVP